MKIITPFLRIYTTTVFICLLSMKPSFAAGFHYQLDLTAKLVHNQTNELTAIQMSWIYDKELSAILMDGEDLSVANREKALEKRKAEIFSGLSEVNYFTTVLLDKHELEVGKVETYKLRLNKESRLQMNLKLPLRKPQVLQGHTLEIVITDDSAIGLATFVDTNHMLLGERFKQICKTPDLVQKKLAEVDGHAPVIETMTINCR